MRETTAFSKARSLRERPDVGVRLIEAFTTAGAQVELHPTDGIEECLRALAGLGGIDPAEAAHIGDLRRTDIAGARAMGMTAVRYTGVFDDDSQTEPEGDLVIADHRLLPGLLKIGPAGDDHHRARTEERSP